MSDEVNDIATAFAEHSDAMIKEREAREAHEAAESMDKSIKEMYSGLIGPTGKAKAGEDAEYEARAREMFPNSPGMWAKSNPNLSNNKQEAPAKTGEVAFEKSPGLYAVPSEDEAPAVIYDAHGQELVSMTSGQAFPSSPGMTGTRRDARILHARRNSESTVEDRMPTPVRPETEDTRLAGVMPMPGGLRRALEGQRVPRRR